MNPLEADASHIVAVVVTFISTVGGYVIARRNVKPQELKAEADVSAALLANYDVFTARLQKEVDRVNSTCQERIEALREEYDEDRERWARERQELVRRIHVLEEKYHQLLMLAERRSDPREN